MVQGLVQIGGFLAILKFSLMLKIYHRRQFKKSLTKELKSKVKTQRIDSLNEKTISDESSTIRDSMLEGREEIAKKKDSIFTYEHF